MATHAAASAHRTVSQLMGGSGDGVGSNALAAAVANNLNTIASSNSDSGSGAGGDADSSNTSSAAAVHRRLTDVAGTLLQNGTAWMLAPLNGRRNDSDNDANDTDSANNYFGSPFLDTADFSEDALLFRTFWDTATNSTASTPAASPAGASVGGGGGGAAFTFPDGSAAAGVAGDVGSWWLLLANGTNSTNGDGLNGTATLLADANFAWLTPDMLQQLVGGVTAVLLGFVILATVIGKCYGKVCALFRARAGRE